MKFYLYYKLQKKAELLIINDEMDEHFCEASKILPDPHINNVVVVVEDIPYFFSLMYYEMTRKKLWHVYFPNINSRLHQASRRRQTVHYALSPSGGGVCSNLWK